MYYFKKRSRKLTTSCALKNETKVKPKRAMERGVPKLLILPQRTFLGLMLHCVKSLKSSPTHTISNPLKSPWCTCSLYIAIFTRKGFSKTPIS
ncbi:hypothetical protein B9Q12_03745 [Candidatus Marsarchaeota G2 archaeon ECH_B_SAG-G06]|uniref:Uncharacterized protein n=1 Tax=Candidatus Marsarchaeota G2 archaeon ECH_B_SAG-G06 TaxID=1978166 RepID=A0A2R6BYQ9_9ARCH|nr:MAG: hypothetical protein B9Q12_03745 [Candidatus Marsarchaeota G2 archaeon ECH_B_SAG-G06]